MKPLTLTLSTFLPLALSLSLPVAADCPERCQLRYDNCMKGFQPDHTKACTFNVCLWWKEKEMCKECPFCVPPLCNICNDTTAAPALETMEEVSSLIDGVIDDA